MFVIQLEYLAPLEKLDALMPAHMQFLRTQYASGQFLTSGRKVPRTGGVILAVGSSSKEISDLMNNDPFVREGLASFTVTEFMNSQMHPLFKAMIEALGKQNESQAKK